MNLPPPLPHMLSSGRKLKVGICCLLFSMQKRFLLLSSPLLHIYNAENQCELFSMQKNRVVVLLQKIFLMALTWFALATDLNESVKA